MNDESNIDESEDSIFLKSVGSLEALRDAWRYLNKSNPDSYGLSGDTISNFSKDLDTRLSIISKQLLSGSYKFSKTRASLIPKDNGQLRPLQIPEISDRVVLKSLAINLEKQLAPKLNRSREVSFAYQRETGIEDVTKKIREYFEEGYTWVLEADIIKFFDRVEKRRLLNEQVFPNIPNASAITDLIERGISQPIDTSEISQENLQYFTNIDTGIPQGNPLSPLFSNIYLYQFDEYMINNSYKLIRYADDFIVMLASQEEAENCHRKISKFLSERLDLDLHPMGEKTRIVDLNRNSFTFLSITFDGKEFYPSAKSVKHIKERIDKVCFGKKPNKTVLEILMRVKNTLDGWLSAYSFTSVDRYIEEVDSHINRQLYRVFAKLGWKLSKKGKLSNKYWSGNSSRDCLNEHQRRNSGVPFSKTILAERRKENITGPLMDAPPRGKKPLS